jgi:hypothetical protein
MSFKTANFLTSLLMSAVVVAYPLAAEAGGMSRIGTYGNNNGAKAGQPSGPNCKEGSGGGGGGGGGHSGGYPSTTINNNINVYKPTTINKNVNVYKPIDINKSVNVTNNIDDSKNITINKPISITKNIDNSKYIDDSKSINISKSIVINNGAGEAAALAVAVAAAGASASASVNVYGSSSSFSNSMSGGVFNYSPEAPTVYTGGDLGSLSVEAAAPAAATPVGMGYAPGQCTYQDATVVKSIHAMCVSDDGHEFPASHMTSETWINSAYEGELARCLPGSRLKVVMSKASPIGMGLASASSGDVLQCGVHEALRHYKDGVLKCALAVPVPDCTERTNLRKYGTGDMFFSYRTKICAETSQEYVGQMSRTADANRPQN